jgi:hypothetical protein
VAGGLCGLDEETMRQRLDGLALIARRIVIVSGMTEVERHRPEDASRRASQMRGLHDQRPDDHKQLQIGRDQRQAGNLAAAAKNGEKCGATTNHLTRRVGTDANHPVGCKSISSETSAAGKPSAVTYVKKAAAIARTERAKEMPRRTHSNVRSAACSLTGYNGL